MANSDLYFIFNSYTGLVKIGIAGDVPSRLRGLECSCGVRLEVLAVFDGCERYEQPLHMAFADSRQVGEWFIPTPDIIGLIERTETITDLLRRYAPKIEQHRLAAMQRSTAKQEELKADREREKERLAVVRAEERRIKKEEAAKRAAAKAKRDAREARRAEERRQQLEEERARWQESQPAELATTSLIRGWTPDRLRSIVSERSTLVRESQRARNCATVGVKVTQ